VHTIVPAASNKPASVVILNKVWVLWPTSWPTGGQPVLAQSRYTTYFGGSFVGLV